MVSKSILERDKTVYNLDAFTKMPNHVHMVFAPTLNANGKPHPLSTTMKSLKQWTAGQANELLERKEQ